MTGRLEQRVALVAGGAVGVGRGIARRFAREGATVVIADVNDIDGPRTAEGLESLGGRGVFIPTDVRDRQAVFAAVDTCCETFRTVHVLVNSAIALTPEVPLEEKTDDMLDRSLGLGLRPVWWAMKAAFPHMQAQGGGSIINFHSLDGMVGRWLRADYNVTKEAIRGLSRSAASEWGRYGIRVNVISPAAMGSDQQQRVATSSATTGWRHDFPLGRIGDPEDDIGGAALFLASEDSQYVTGATLPVDGGKHMWRYDGDRQSGRAAARASSSEGSRS